MIAHRWDGDTGFLADENQAWWSAKVKGKNAWVDGVSAASRTEVARNVYRKFGKRWRQHVSVRPEVRRRERQIERERREHRKERDAAWPTCDGNSEGFAHLCSFKLSGDVALKKKKKKKGQSNEGGDGSGVEGSEGDV